MKLLSQTMCSTVFNKIGQGQPDRAELEHFIWVGGTKDFVAKHQSGRELQVFKNTYF